MDIHPALLAPPAPPEPVSVIDVAEHILTASSADGADEMPWSKLHALVYLCQGWHLATTGTPLFLEPIEAWAEGPVVPTLHALHTGQETLKAGQLHEKLASLATVDPDDVLRRATAGYDAWYSTEPVPGEDDSVSHEYVREVVPDLIEALRVARAELATARRTLNHE